MQRRSPEASHALRSPSQIITLCGVAVFWLLLCDGRPWRLFARGGFSSDFYDVQARAFLDGRLSVPAEVAGIEGFVVEGSTYLYYGPWLAIARIPTALFGPWADGRLTRLSMLLAFVVLCKGTFRLVIGVARLLGTRDVRPWQPAVVISAVVCSPVLWLASEPYVYQETEIWAAALFVVTLALLSEVIVSPTRRLAGLISLFVLLVTSTRVSVGLGAAAAAVMVGMVLLRRGSPRIGIGLAITSAASVTSSFLLTYAKVGSFNLPFTNQVLSIADPERMAWFDGNNGSFFRLDFIPTTTLHYLRPDGLDFGRVFPFVAPPPNIDLLGDYPLESYYPTASLTATAPLLVGLALVGSVLTARGRHTMVLCLSVGAGIAAGPTLAIGYVAGRYLLDLLPVVVLLGIVTITWVGDQAPARLRAWQRFGFLLVLWGFAMNVLLTVAALGLSRPGFIDFRHSVDEAAFGGPSHGVVRVEEAPSAEGRAVGLLAVAGDCDGLYVSDAISWQAVERADGVLERRFVVDPGATPILLDGPGGTLSVEPAAEGVLDVRLELPSGTAFNDKTPWNGGLVGIEIVSDPWATLFFRGLSVVVDNEIVLRDLFATPDLTAMFVQPGVEDVVREQNGVPVCRALANRGFREDR